jgi:hypothetical protein
MLVISKLLVLKIFFPARIFSLNISNQISNNFFKLGLYLSLIISSLKNSYFEIISKEEIYLLF